MHILMIAPQQFYSDRGTPINVKLMCQVLGQNGHKIDLLVFPTGRGIALKNTNIIRLPNILGICQIQAGPSLKKIVYDLVMIPSAVWLVIKNRYEILHGIEEGGFLAVILGRIFKITSIIDMDSIISEQLKYTGFIQNHLLLKLVNFLENWCLKRSSAVITVCAALSEWVRRFSPHADIYQIEDVPIISTAEFKEELPDEFNNKCELKHKIIVLYTGNLASYQGIDLLLDAWKLFCSKEKKNKAFKLVIVGGTAHQVSHYQQLAISKGIQEFICWVGQRPSSEIGKWMKISRVLVSPRLEGDNTPLKIYSYMSSGRPIVATRRETHTQVLNNTMAFLAEPAPVPFCDAIDEALKNPELAKRKAAKAIQIVEEKYCYDVFSKKLLAAYASLGQHH
jgi:glycosyltransferase involved in cell wall biosynthesis